MRQILHKGLFMQRHLKLSLLFLLTLSIGSLVKANDPIKIPHSRAYPAPLLHLDSYFTHHVIVAEKSTHTLHLFRNNNTYPELIKSYVMTTGKKPGDKLFEGDYRTPEGIFFLTEFLPHSRLVQDFGSEGEIYGVGAFVMNYPNPVDLQRNKTGHGIWLHSTNDETRIDKGLDSRGCIVTANNHLIEISKYIELERTKIVVVQNLNWISENAWLTKRSQLLETVEQWRESWEKEDLPRYISFYHQEKFHDPRRGGIDQFKAFKRSIFSNPGKPRVDIMDLSLIVANGYATATFRQDYESRTLADIGRKTLYLKQDTYYQWKIVSENWTKRGIDEESAKPAAPIAFEPSLRFFPSRKAHDIMDIFTVSQDSSQ